MFKKLILILIFVNILNIKINAQQLDGLKNQKAFKFSGSLSANFSMYGQTGSLNNRRDPFSQALGGNATISFYGVDIPFSLSYANQQSNFNGPFQRFGISPSYKKLKMHLGYRNLNFSQFGLSSQTLYGGGLEFNTSKFRMAFMYGRINEAIVNNGLNISSPSAFSRRAIAGKIGYEGQRNHILFSALYGKDDSTSITDYIQKRNTRPQENLVLTVSIKKTIYKNLFIKIEGGASEYTRDTRAKIANPKDLNPIIKWQSTWFNVHESTQLLMAGESTLGFTSKKVNLNLKYRYVQPDYKTMGAYYFQSDLKQLTIQPAFTLFKSKALLSGSIGFQEDNLKKLKQTTTKRIIGNGNLAINTSPSFGIDLSFSNYGLKQRGTNRGVDTVKVQSVNNSISIAPHWQLMRLKYQHLIQTNISYQKSSDFNIINQQTNNFDGYVANVNYAINKPEKKIGANLGLVYTDNRSQDFMQQSINGNIGFNKSLEKAHTTLSAGYSTYKQFNADGMSQSINTGVIYTPFKKQQLNFNFNYVMLKQPSLQGQPMLNVNETYATLGYTYNF
ncbi:MAG: hypothetical protein EAZ15_05005 [Sphingobacteriales bacterium]|nr:MAG: hypothetical protein EAZ15_05005 [Sphingobacteriales bacterium]